MPYIKKERRRKLRWKYEHRIKTSGELNYLLTRLSTEYLEQRGESYKTISDIVGALECAKTEFYRRVVVPYEEKKIKENGDVY